jgi:site-specific DNA-methyltransferase (adenine-specific)
MGSGTTAIAAIRENRNYIGVELDPEYVKLSKINILKETGINPIITFNAN